MKPALIVIDCQYDFIKNRSPYACQMFDSRLIGNIRKLIGYCRQRHIPIIYTQHSIKRDKSNAEFGEPENIKACIVGTKGWEIVNELKPKAKESVVQKDKYDAFWGTKLDKLLRKTGINTLILSGVLTNNCVRATAEGAHYRGYKLIVVSDCCGATSYTEKYTHKQIHDITLSDLEGRVYETIIVPLRKLKIKKRAARGRAL